VPVIGSGGSDFFYPPHSTPPSNTFFPSLSLCHPASTPPAFPLSLTPARFDFVLLTCGAQLPEYFKICLNSHFVAGCVLSFDLPVFPIADSGQKILYVLASYSVPFCLPYDLTWSFPLPVVVSSLLVWQKTAVINCRFPSFLYFLPSLLTWFFPSGGDLISSIFFSRTLPKRNLSPSPTISLR